MEADAALLRALRELGLPEAEARRALAMTGNVSAEAAAQLYFGGLEAQEQAGGSGYKMVFVVNAELAMSAGKCKKIVVQGSNTAHLMDLQALALSLELPMYLVQDAGRTQVPAGSYTVLAIIGEEEMVNQVTGNLRLLN